MRRHIVVALLALLALAACAVLWSRPDSYASQDREATMSAASGRHWTGTDALGRDRAVRVAAAMVIGLTGAAIAAAITTGLAAMVGMAAAFGSRPLRIALLFISDIFLALPWVFLLMIVRSLLPLTVAPAGAAAATFLLLAALGWPACARAVYQGSSNLNAADWMIQGRAGGLRTRQLVRSYILPNLRPLLLPQFLVCVPAFLIAEANLGVLGLGVPEPLPSWGAMLLELDNSALLATSHWVWLPLALLVTVLLLLESLASEV